MKSLTINSFSSKTFTRLISISVIITFLMFGANFNSAAMSNWLLIVILSVSILFGALGFIGFALRIAFLWSTFSGLERFHDVLKLFLLGLLTGFSMFISVAMISSSLNYPQY